MHSVFQKIASDNNSLLTTFLDKKLFDINIIDSQLCEMVTIDISHYEVHFLKEEIIYKHLIISRTIAQIGVNLYRNNNYYKDNKLGNLNLLETIEDGADRRFFIESLHSLLDQTDCTNESLLHITKLNVLIYLISYKILQSFETAKAGPQFNSTEETDFSFDSSINTERGAENSLNSLQCNWQCDICDIVNDNSKIVCDGCETNRPIKRISKRLSSCNKNLNEIEVKSYEPEKKILRKINVDKNESVKRDEFKEGVTSSLVGTTLNTFDQDTSTVCDEVGAHYDKSTCEECMFINDKLQAKCVACDKVNSYLTKCPKCKLSDINIQYDVACNNCIGTVENDIWESRKVEYHGNSSDVMADKWTCEECTFINDKLQATWVACDKVNSYLAKCPKCKLSDINIQYDVACDNCIGTVESSTCALDKVEYHGNGRDVTVDKWPCSACSFRNYYDDTKCTVCGHDGPHLNKWRCDRCTYINNTFDSQCNGCEAHNPFRDTNDQSSQYNPDTDSLQCRFCYQHLKGIFKEPICDICRAKYNSS